MMLTLFESRSYLGIMVFSSALARLLFMLYGGIIADRLNRKLLVLLSQWGEMLLIGSILLCYLTGLLSPFFLIVVSFLFGILNAFSGPAYSSMITSLIDSDDLQRANALLRMANQYSLIVGPLLGSALIISLGFTGVFLSSLAVLLISSLLLNLVRLPLQGVDERSTTPWEDFRSSLEYIRMDRILPILMALGFIMNFFIAGPMGVLIPIMARDILDGNAFVLALLELSLGSGIILGSLAVSVKKTFIRPGFVILSSLILVVLAYGALGFVYQLVFAMCNIFIIGFSIQLANIPLFTYIQTNTEPRMLGRVMGIFLSAVTGLTPLSLALISYLFHQGIDIQLVIRIFGVFLLIITLGAFLISPLRKLSYKSHLPETEGHDMTM
ncbi:MFS transporter [Paenibacillus thiaminolyticus]|uniref:MFS transporter n=1 Tax=Paenibacillus thiaminolyticus TaxID=49283 RepID=UPI00232A82DF|nr:MFS transporter [Paenibacillus thiaminolyticus]WCF06797.1 MFS transporter [Paenibacillus thiaminolyticus]